MAHIHTGPGQHDQTVSAWIVSENEGEQKILMHRHKLFGLMFQPGGHVELNESPWQAVLREIIEETGYYPDQLKLFQPKDMLRTLSHVAVHPYPVVSLTHGFNGDKAHLHTDLSYAFITDQDPSGTIEDGESKDLRWLSLADINSLLDTDIFEDIREIASYVLSCVAVKWETVSLDNYEV